MSNRLVAIFGSSQTPPDSTAWREAEDLGFTIAEAGFGVITGGYGGTMEAASRGACRAGGHTVGVIAPSLFLGRTGANEHVAEIVEATSLANRIGELVARADGAIALPGSIGTATELLIAWNVNHIVRRNGGEIFPTVAVGSGWREVAAVLTSGIGAFPGDVHLVDTAQEGAAWLIERL